MRVIQAMIGFALLAGCTHMGHEATAPPAPVAQAAPATPPTPAPTSRFSGEVTAATATQFSLRGADGAITTIATNAETLIVVGHLIQASDIHPGDFVATANTNVDDTSGTSVELRVFPPGVRLGEGSRPMQEPNTTMTNATVAEVTDVSNGRVLTVQYPGGTRRITLPATIPVVGQARGDHSVIHPGSQLRVFARPDANGVMTAFYIYTGENGAAPPGR